MLIFIVLILFLLFLTKPASSAKETKMGIMRFDASKNLDPALGGAL